MQYAIPTKSQEARQAVEIAVLASMVCRPPILREPRRFSQRKVLGIRRAVHTMHTFRTHIDRSEAISTRQLRAG